MSHKYIEQQLYERLEHIALMSKFEHHKNYPCFDHFQPLDEPNEQIGMEAYSYMLNSVSQWGTLKNILVDKFIDDWSDSSSDISEEYDNSHFDQGIVIEGINMKYMTTNTIKKPDLLPQQHYEVQEKYQRNEFLKEINGTKPSHEVEWIDSIGAFWGDLTILETLETHIPKGAKVGYFSPDSIDLPNEWGRTLL